MTWHALPAGRRRRSRLAAVSLAVLLAAALGGAPPSRGELGRAAAPSATLPSPLLTATPGSSGGLPGNRPPARAAIDGTPSGGAGAQVAALPATPFSYYPPLPAGPVGVDRPVLSIHVVLQEGADPRAFDYHLSLDGREVGARFDGQFVTFRPSLPLAPGAHRATASLSLAGWSKSLSWTFDVRPVARPAPPAPALQELARRAVNGYRLLAGLDPLAAEESLADAARAHAQFFVANANRYGSVSLAVHQEDPAWAGFTGVNPWDRAAYWGYSGNTVENMAFGRGTVDAVDTWMDSVYHRFAILDATLRAVGYDIEGDPSLGDDFPVTDLEVGEWQGGGRDVPSSTIIAYPVNNQTDVPLSFLAGEVPDPLSAFPGAAYPAGYPITLQFPSLHTIGVSVDSGSLTTSSGAPVKVYVLVPNGNSSESSVLHLGQAMAMIPAKPLLPLSSYRAHVTGRYLDDNGVYHPFDRTWTFRTARWDFPQAKTVLRSWSGTTITALRVTCQADVSRASVYVDGRPVERLAHPTATTLDFALPPGTYTASSVMTIQQPGGPAERWVGFLGADRMVIAGDAAWQPVDLRVGNRSYPKGAAESGSRVFLPAGLLRTAGLAFATAADGAILVSDTQGALLGAFHPGDAMAFLPDPAGGLQRMALSVPPRVADGVTYLPLDLARALLKPVGQFARFDPAAALAEVYPWLNDITGYWAEANVRDLASKGIVSGFEDGLFHPGQSLSRAQFVKMLATSLGLSARPGDTGGIAAPPSHWVVAQGWLGAAAVAGIVAPSDYPAGFAPDQDVTRLEMAYLMERWLGAKGKPLPAASGPYPFVDVDGLSRADRDRVASLAAAGLLKGESIAGGGRAFRPGRAMTRAEAAAVVDRMLAYGAQPAPSSEAAPSR